jgi:hypothetical protein
MVLALDAANMKSYDERVNSFTYSEDFTNAAWVKSSVGVTGNATTGPTVNGVVLNADKITETAVTAQFLVIQNPYTAVAGDVNTISVYAKASERTQLTITSFGEGYAVFNLDTGTVYQTGGHVCSITDAGNGWYRCSATITEVNVTASSWYIGMWKNNTNVYAGTAGQGLFIAGAQFDRNRTFASRYVKTVAAGVSASATWTDLINSSKTGTLTNGPTFNNSNGGSIVFDGVNDYVDFGFVNISAGTSLTVEAWVKPGITQNNYADILDYDHDVGRGFVVQQNNTATNQYYFAYWNGSAYEITSTITLSTSTYNHLVFTKSGTSVLGYLNGQNLVNYTGSATITLTGRTLYVGKMVSVTARYFNGNIAKASFYDRALTDVEIQQNFNALRGRFNI